MKILKLWKYFDYHKPNQYRQVSHTIAKFLLLDFNVNISLLKIKTNSKSERQTVLKFKTMLGILNVLLHKEKKTKSFIFFCRLIFCIQHVYVNINNKIIEHQISSSKEIPIQNLHLPLFITYIEDNMKPDNVFLPPIYFKLGKRY